jgi:hypothetical protein
MARPQPTNREPSPAPQPYEPPQLTVLGSLAEMTLGHVAAKSDGINPGSLIGR